MILIWKNTTHPRPILSHEEFLLQCKGGIQSLRADSRPHKDLRQRQAGKFAACGDVGRFLGLKTSIKYIKICKIWWIWWCMNYVKWILTLHSLGSFNCESCPSDPIRWGIEGNHLGYAWRYHYGFVGPDPLDQTCFFCKSKIPEAGGRVPIVRYGEYTLQGFITLQGHFGWFYILTMQILYCILQLNWMMMMRRRRRIQVPIAVLTWLTQLTHPRSLKKPRPQWRRKEHDNVHYDRHESVEPWKSAIGFFARCSWPHVYPFCCWLVGLGIRWCNHQDISGVSWDDLRFNSCI